ncbi:MAG: hypothetical protein U0869_07340 [Chloroflexota bacterium]
MGGGTALAVGSTGEQLGTRTARYERWTGSRWTVLGGPAITGKLNAIARVPGTATAWAVGAEGADAVVVRWDGHAWRRAALAHAGMLLSVDVAPDGTVQAVGYEVVGGTARALVLRRDAHGWTAESLPAITGRTVLRGVSARTSTDAWAVGSREGPLHLEPLILHRTVTGWHVVAGPTINAASSLAAVVATGPGSFTAVGSTTDGAGEHALVVDRAGGAWTVATPGAGLGTEVLDAVIRADGATWAAGTAGQWGTATGVILRRTALGSAWTARAADHGLTPLSGIARVAAGRYLAVGGELDGLDVRSSVRCG